MVFLTSTSRVIRDHPASEIDFTTRAGDFHIYAHTSTAPVTPHVTGRNASHPAVQRAQAQSDAKNATGATHQELERDMQRAANQLGLTFVLHVNAPSGKLDPSYSTARPPEVPTRDNSRRAVPGAFQLSHIFSVPTGAKHLAAPDINSASERALKNAGLWRNASSTPLQFTHFKIISPQPNNVQPVTNFPHLQKFLAPQEALILDGIITQRKAQLERAATQRKIDSAPKVPLRRKEAVDPLAPTSAMVTLPIPPKPPENFEPFPADDTPVDRTWYDDARQQHDEHTAANANAKKQKQDEIEQLVRAYNEEKLPDYTRQPKGPSKQLPGRMLKPLKFANSLTRDDVIDAFKYHLNNYTSGRPVNDEQHSLLAADHYNQLADAVDLLKELIPNKQVLHLLLQNDADNVPSDYHAGAVNAYRKIVNSQNEAHRDAYTLAVDGLADLPLNVRNQVIAHLIEPKPETETQLGQLASEFSIPSRKPNAEHFYGKPILDFKAEEKRLKSGKQGAVRNGARKST